MTNYRTFIMFIIMFLLVNCGGGSSAPTSPVQIPTEISFANENEYGGGVVIQMGKSITATSDADFSGGEVMFTDSATGEEDTAGLCGTASIDGETITLTGPDSWPNAESQCSVSFLYDDDAIPIQIADASVSAVEKNLAKADSGSDSVTAYYDTSDTVLEGSGLEITTSTLRENAVKGSISAYGSYVHGCYLTLAQSGANLITDEMVYIRSADNGATWTDPVIIVDLGTVTVSNVTYGKAEDCRIEAGVDSSGNGLIALVEKYKDADATALKNLVLKISRDNGATWSDGVTFVERTAIDSDRIAVLINSDVVHIAYNATDGKHIVPCTISGSTATCGSSYSIAGLSSHNDNEVNLAAYGNTIYAVYTDNSYSAGNAYNDAVLKVLSYSSGSYTVANTYQLSSADATTGNATDAFVSVDNDGLVLGIYSYASEYNAIVAVVDTSTDAITRNSINETSLSETPHFVKPFVSAANHYHFLYGLVGPAEGVYKLCDSSFSCANDIPVDISTLQNIQTFSVDRYGRVYIFANPLTGEGDLYQSGTILLGRFTLNSD